MADALADILPAYTGSRFTPTLHSAIPPKLDPSSQTLPTPFVVLITGASGGIGAATALAFAKAGASGIVITARKEASLEETKKACEGVAKNTSLKVVALGAEAGRDESVAKHVADVVKKEFGRLDVLVNNAGVLATNATAFERRFEDMDTSQFFVPTDTNYAGRFLLMKHTIPLLLSSADGAKAVVSISSVGSHLPHGGNVAFGISAMANNRLVEAAAERYKSEGLLCYSVHPGAVRSTPHEWIPASLTALSIDDIGLCGAFLIWLLQERREWLSGRYMSAEWDVDELVSKKDEIVAGDKLVFRMVL